MTTLKTKTDAAKAVSVLRATFDTGATKKRSWRETQLTGLRNMLIENEGAIEAALFSDLGKSATEAQVTEIGIVLGEINGALKNLGEWLSRERVKVPLAMMPARASIMSEPLGVTLIIAPWNYPLMLALAPLVGALAAGNCVALKPSELSSATSAALSRPLQRKISLPSPSNWAGNHRCTLTTRLTLRRPRNGLCGRNS